MQTNQPHRALAGAFYYIALSLLTFMLCTAIYWQLESDDITLSYNELEVTTTPGDRMFLVPVQFCSPKLTEFTVVRYYWDVKQNIYYGVPDGRYKTSNTGCFDNRLTANTGRLEPGDYEYHVSVSYAINPLRTKQSKVVVARVRVE